MLSTTVNMAKFLCVNGIKASDLIQHIAETKTLFSDKKSKYYQTKRPF